MPRLGYLPAAGAERAAAFGHRLVAGLWPSDGMLVAIVSGAFFVALDCIRLGLVLSHGVRNSLCRLP